MATALCGHRLAHNLAKVGVGGSNPLARSRSKSSDLPVFLGIPWLAGLAPSQAETARTDPNRPKPTRKRGSNKEHHRSAWHNLGTTPPAPVALMFCLPRACAGSAWRDRTLSRTSWGAPGDFTATAGPPIGPSGLRQARAVIGRPCSQTHGLVARHPEAPGIALFCCLTD